MDFVFLLCTILSTIPVSGDTSDIVISSTMYKSKSLYETAEDAVLKLHNRYPDISSLENIGESIQGRDITALQVGAEPLIKASSSNTSGIIIGKALNQVEYTKTVKLYDKPEGKVIGTAIIAEPIKLLSLSYDGWYKILTDKYTIAYIDARYVQVDPGQSRPLPSKNMLEGKKLDDTYITIVNQNKQTIEIYEKAAEEYKKIIESTVSTGKVETPTPNGWFTAKSRRGKYSFIPKYQLGTPYFVQLKGGYLLHGLPMNSKGQIPKDISDALGSKASHGCIRLPMDVAKFVYLNIKEDSLVVIDNDPPPIEEIVKVVMDSD